MNEIRLLFRKDVFIIINNIKLILKNPFRLLPYAALVGYFSFIYMTRSKDRLDREPVKFSDIKESLPATDQVDLVQQTIVGGLTLLALGFFLFQLYRATKKNVSFFTMADVNLLFTAPVSPSNILVYYMVRSLLPAIGGSMLFMVYGGSQLAGTFELTFLNVAMMATGVALFFFILSPIRFLIYTLNTKYEILPYIKSAIFITGLLLLLSVIIPGALAEKFWQGMFAWVYSQWFDFFPVVGWSRAIFAYIAHENLWISMGFISVYVLTFFLILKMVLVHSEAYYEDVLETTQSNEEVKEKAKGKKEASESSFSLNTGKKLALPDFGEGAIALYWRNYVHSSRQDFHPLLGLFGLLLAGIGIVLAVLSNFDWFSHRVIYWYMIILLSIYFFAGVGRSAVGDLKKPFFILIPASWPAKFWNMIKLDVIQIFLFSMVLVVPAVWIASLHWGLIPLFVFCMLLFYFSGFSIMLTTNVGFDEGWDRKLMKPLIILGVLFFGIFPSIGAGIFAFIITGQFVIGLFALTIGMAVVAGVLLNLSLDLIKKIEIKEL